MNVCEKTCLDKEITPSLLSCLPASVSNEIISSNLPKIDEIRLRVGGLCSLISDKKQIKLNSFVTKADADKMLRIMCDGSLYAYRDSISKGYITLNGGIRVGVCGRAVCENGRLTGVYDISSFCIRIPHEIHGVGHTVCRLIRATGKGVLIYSPPGVGKTTLLRSVISILAGGSAPLRLAVIDSRGELSAKLKIGLSADILSGYPKGNGIETAARTLNPELIVCDEIGSDLEEISAIKAAHNCGVPLLATAHADNVSELLRRTGIAALHEARVFGSYVGIKRGSGNDFRYEVTPYDDTASCT